MPNGIAPRRLRSHLKALQRKHFGRREIPLAMLVVYCQRFCCLAPDLLRAVRQVDELTPPNRRISKTARAPQCQRQSA